MAIMVRAVPSFGAMVNDARLALDHVFVCVNPARPEAEALRELGFRLKFQREHPGQGTANELLLFPESYLELLYLVDADEAKANPMRLDRRCEYAQTGASPFGILLRGERAAVVADPDAWFAYRLDGMPEPLWVLRVSLDEPARPLLAVFERNLQRGGPFGPRQQGYPPALFDHPNGATSIAGVELHGPGYGRWADWAWPAGLSLVEGEQVQMKVRTSAEVRGRVGALLTLG